MHRPHNHTPCLRHDLLLARRDVHIYRGLAQARALTPRRCQPSYQKVHVRRSGMQVHRPALVSCQPVESYSFSFQSFSTLNAVRVVQHSVAITHSGPGWSTWHDMVTISLERLLLHQMLCRLEWYCTMIARWWFKWHKRCLSHMR